MACLNANADAVEQEKQQRGPQGGTEETPLVGAWAALQGPGTGHWPRTPVGQSSGRQARLEPTAGEALAGDPVADQGQAQLRLALQQLPDATDLVLSL